MRHNLIIWKHTCMWILDKGVLLFIYMLKLVQLASPLLLAAAVACDRGITFRPCRPCRPWRVLMFRVPPWKPGGSRICWAPPCCNTNVPPCALNACEANTTVWWPPVACEVRITFCKQSTFFHSGRKLQNWQLWFTLHLFIFFTIFQKTNHSLMGRKVV